MGRSNNWADKAIGYLEWLDRSNGISPAQMGSRRGTHKMVRKLAPWYWLPGDIYITPFATMTSRSMGYLWPPMSSCLSADVPKYLVLFVHLLPNCLPNLPSCDCDRQLSALNDIFLRSRQLFGQEQEEATNLDQKLGIQLIKWAFLDLV